MSTFKIINCCHGDVKLSHTEPQDTEDNELQDIYTALQRSHIKEQESEALTKLKKFADLHKNDKLLVSDRLRKFRRQTDGSFVSLLHVAALSSWDEGVFEQLITTCPDLIGVKRTCAYEGQTALHITVAKRKRKATEVLLKNIRDSDRKEILGAKATGAKLKNTVMMGETLLSIAFLTFDLKMISLLLDYGASLLEVNSKGDTIVHTLIKYTAVDAQKTNKVVHMLRFLKDLTRARSDGKVDWNERLWFAENKEQLSPLVLSASLHASEVFQALMKMKDVFYFPVSVNDAENIEFYDVTEIDKIARILYYDNKKYKDFKETMPNLTFYKLFHLFQSNQASSVVERVSSLSWKHAKIFMENEVISLFIQTKWRAYRAIYWVHNLLNLMALLIFTTSIYYRKNPDTQDAKSYARVAPWFLFIYGVFLLVSEVRRWLILNDSKIWHLNYFNNWLYRICSSLFAMGCIIDCIALACGITNMDVFVIVILLSGCFFIFFALLTWDKVSFYIILFQKVIMGDFIRFISVVGVEFTAFSFAFFIIMYDNRVTVLTTMWECMVKIFEYMLGLSELDILDEVDTNSKRLVAVLYVLFILTNYLMLINFLIAMLNKTCRISKNDKKLMSTMQKSSIMLFLDNVVLWHHSYVIRRYLKTEIPTSKFSKNNRYYMSFTREEIRKRVDKVKYDAEYLNQELKIKHNPERKQKIRGYAKEMFAKFEKKEVTKMSLLKT